MVDIKKNILLFFDRPTEPCFMQKGDERAVFDLPDNYYPKKYKDVAKKLSNRFNSDALRNIPVRNIELPNLQLPLQLGYREQFSLFIPKHREMAAALINLFLGAPNLEVLQSLCSYCQLRINPYMFNYCLSVALLHRPDTKGINIPSLTESFPDKFMSPKVIRRAREVSSTVTDGPRIPITIPQNYTASEIEPEQRVAYFREDIGINLHHWHWHLVYPFDSSDRAIVDKDRRGELFYYMHQQIIARYNAERFCNNLGRVVRFSNLREPIAEGYFPKLDSQVASRTWPPRFADSIVTNLDRPIEEIKKEVNDMELWREHIIEAINSNSILLPDGSQMTLDEVTGIDVLGNVIESSMISPNRAYYGDFHNMGHIFFSYIHDPDHRNLEPFGVIGDSGTAMRDPIFYRWHAHINDLFEMYKSKLPPYGENKLSFSGIVATSISVEGSAGRNTFGTHWEQSTLELSYGLDFAPRGSVPARFTHLQHDEFDYVIVVNNTTGKSATGTIRIFMAPNLDDNGSPMTFDDQRKLMIELDKFSQELTTGENTIRRKSVDSSVTIPYERSFRNQAERVGAPKSATAAEFNFCGCGWPHHLLIPKGTTMGYPVSLFVMVSNWEQDKVEQDLAGSSNDAASYCGIRDKKYPDRQPMGYPFDRPSNPDVNTLDKFLLSNMSVTNCNIRFTDEVKPRPQ